MKKYIVRTLGCKANLFDSQLIEAELQKRGWAPVLPGTSGQGADLCIINSCTVTDEADRQSRKLAARMARENPRAAVVVTGCAAEVDPERLVSSAGVQYVIGNRGKPQLVELILAKIASGVAVSMNDSGGEVLGSGTGYEEMASRHPMDRDWPTVADFGFSSLTTGITAKTRMFLKIQEGCNSFCTYCVIPYGRGPARSLDPEQVLERVRKLVSEGVREIVVTGTNIGDYGTDYLNEPQLELLLRRMLSETKIERLRVSSLDPTEISAGILELARSDSRLCPHFHVSLQSPHEAVLKRMKRRYGRKEIEKTLNAIAALPAGVGGPYVGMDVITGFPGETAEIFRESLEFLRSLPWARLHVFPYSERAGTPATRLDGSIAKSERVHRAQILNQLSVERVSAHHQRVVEATSQSGVPLVGVLAEHVNRAPRVPESVQSAGLAEPGSWVAGYTPNYLRVYVALEKGSRIRENDLIACVPIAALQDSQAADSIIVAREAH